MISYLQVEGLTKSYGETLLFENISFGINKEQKIALIARNGTGKTSLLNIIAGLDVPESGQVTTRNDVKIGYLEQNPFFDDNKSVLEYALFSSDNIINAIVEYEKALKGTDKTALQHAMEQMDILQAWDYDTRIKQILGRLDICNFDQPLRELSGGQKRRIALANFLINEPDLLIMDEPTNHLDMEMIEWLEEYLKKSSHTLFMVTHDRYFLDRVCDEIIELDDQTAYRYRGNYSYFLEKRCERIHNKNTNIVKANALLKKELEWMHKSPLARTSKSKSRIEGVYKLKEEASHRVKEQKFKIDIRTSRLGKKILELYNLEKRFDNMVILDDFTYKFKKDDKIGIVGKNGSGKTTLLNIITGNESLDRGKIDKGETVVPGYYRQSGIKLNEDKRIIQVIKEVAEVIILNSKKNNGSRKLSAAQFLEYFLFPPEMHYQYVSKLSGGEKQRLYLMTILMNNPNFLILDEPTNDLDILTLNVLEEYLQNFGGCVLIVSHDRYFMDKVVDTLFIFEGNGKIKHFPGNYSDYRDYRQLQEDKEKKTKKIEKVNEEKAPKQSRKKFSFKEKYELDQLEKELETLENKKQELENNIGSGKLSPNEMAEKSEHLNEVIQIIDEKEYRWLELTDLKE